MRISLTAINNTYKSTCHKAVQISSIALLLTAMVTLAHAATDIPSKGMTQDQVRNTFGEPSKTKAAVGQPPISRWDYENYSVYFEDKYVIHSFLHGQKLKPQLNPEASTGSATSQSNQNNEQGSNQQDATSQAIPNEPDSEPQVTEELDQTEQEQSNQEEQAKQETEASVAEEAQASQQIEEPIVEEVKINEETQEPVEQEMQAAVSEEKDLNFEENPETANYDKWDY